MPEDYLHIKIERTENEQSRILTINIKGNKYNSIYEELKNSANISD